MSRRMMNFSLILLGSIFLTACAGDKALRKEQRAERREEKLEKQLSELAAQFPEMDAATREGIRTGRLNPWAIRRNLLDQRKAKRLQEKRRAFVEAHPELRKEIRETILAGKLNPGLTTQEVWDLWGEPDRIGHDVGDWGVRERWFYGDTCVFFDNGKLISFQEGPVPGGD